MLKFAFLSVAVFLVERHSKFLPFFAMYTTLTNAYQCSKHPTLVYMTFAIENVTKQRNLLN